MSFDGPSFIGHIAKRLIHEFAFSAGAGTPGLVGAAKEHPARTQLEKLMPEGIAVRSGIVVDSYGGASRQQDIVIHEKRCPVFSHNDTPEATYFPAEGVIACGEVKSTMNKAEIEDTFEKSASVKRLRRHAEATDEGLGLGQRVSYRFYGSSSQLVATQDDEYDQDNNTFDQIYYFALCEKFGTSPPTTTENVAQFCRQYGLPHSPNFFASLNDGFVAPHKLTSNSIVRAASDADGLIFCDRPDAAFPQLLAMIRLYLRAGRTVSVSHYERYFRTLNAPKPFFPINTRVGF